MEDTGRIFTVVHISSDHLLSDNFTLDPNFHVHTNHIHTMTSKQNRCPHRSHPHNLCPQQSYPFELPRLKV
ncbi:hypothetical protein Bca4012_066891 [Brassica carinata]|uniref:Uncharacterized protein n=1 Tax=Brassica carinata TaxID=52824 RepID=A0A8X7VRX8_BRACI|nr:hypothetical protein Bca52824_019170 [Brassica carinata]